MFYGSLAPLKLTFPLPLRLSLCNGLDWQAGFEDVSLEISKDLIDEASRFVLELALQQLLGIKKKNHTLSGNGLQSIRPSVPIFSWNNILAPCRPVLRRN